MLHIIKIIIIASTWIFANQANHLLLTRIITQPTKAESFSITNPTSIPIDLTNYYVSDSEEYYKITSDPEFTFTNRFNGFTVQFPSRLISPGETLTIVLDAEYKEFYGEDYNPDLVMFGNSDSSMTGSIGLGNQGKIHQTKELIVLFYFDEQNDNIVQDVDYFLWGEYQKQIDKTVIPNYTEDTPSENQMPFIYEAREHYAYSRLNLNEGNEISSNGNGITEHDETSEDFNNTWTLIRLPEFTYGCMDLYAMNYDPLAELEKSLDDLNYENTTNLFDFDINSACRYSFEKILNNELSIDENYKVFGKVVDFFDIRTVSSSGTGPQNITIEDKNGYRVTITVWDWEIATSNISTVLTKFNKNIYYVWANGKLGYYEEGDEWQIEIASNNHIIIAQNFSPEGEYIEDSSINNISINPEPYVLIPTIGETLDYNFTVSEKARVIIRIFDLSGRFITSLIDKYYDKAGTVFCNTPPASWDGRDHLGQIVSPGTYIMHMEAMNPSTGQTFNDAAPIVIGIKN